MNRKRTLAIFLCSFALSACGSFKLGAMLYCPAGAACQSTMVTPKQGGEAAPAAAPAKPASGVGA